MELSHLIDEVLEQGLPVVCAVDQNIFSSQGGYRTNYFSLLRPLMTLDGRLFKKRLEEDFPDRGRLWWLLRDDIDLDLVQPGMVWTVHVEKAPHFKRGAGEKRFDYFQARFSDAAPGANGYYQVLEIPPGWSLDQLLRAELRSAHPPTPRVVCRNEQHLWGPFAARWDKERGTISLEAVNAAEPVVWRIRNADLSKSYQVDFPFIANSLDRQHEEVSVKVSLLKSAGLRELCDQGDALDAATDAQVVNWAVKAAGFSREETKLLRAALETLDTTKLESQGIADRLARFRRIADTAAAVVQLGEEVADSLARQDAFKELVDRHVEGLVEQRVDDRVARREQDIVARTQRAQAQCDQVQAHLDSLEDDFKEKVKEQQQRVREEREAFVSQLERREEEVVRREAELARSEEELRARLEPVIREFREESETVVRRSLSLLPLLGQVAPAAGPPVSAGPGPRSNGKFQLPSFLDRRKPEGGPTEMEFLLQLQSVCKQRGFVYSDDDLANYHISVKIGQWTVLAGPSGIGKSTLPRLYAEALGALDELLWVPVRPDWMDDRDVIGAFNSFLGRFEPAACGLVDRLVTAHLDAERGRGGLYLVVLDEMNLAKVEHYFAQFLSVMELPPDGRTLKLFARGNESSDDPYAPFRNLPLHDNVRFVGTVNVDHTTQFFSPKVIDRAAILLLDDSIPRSSQTVDEGPVAGVRPVHAEHYAAWTRRPDDVPLDKIRARLDTLQGILRRHRAGLGHRTYQRVLAYVAASSQILPEDRALDFAISQSILPRLRNTTPQFVSLLEALSEELPEQRFPRTHGVLARLIETGDEYDFFQVV